MEQSLLQSWFWVGNWSKTTPTSAFVWEILDVDELFLLCVPHIYVGFPNIGPPTKRARFQNEKTWHIQFYLQYPQINHCKWLHHHHFRSFSWFTLTFFLLKHPFFITMNLAWFFCRLPSGHVQLAGKSTGVGLFKVRSQQFSKLFWVNFCHTSTLNPYINP